MKGLFVLIFFNLNTHNESWEIGQVNNRLEEILEKSFAEVLSAAVHYNVSPGLLPILLQSVR